MKILAKNKRAYYDYDIKDTFEAGLVLAGYEVKSAKGGNVSLLGSYVHVSPKGATLVNAHIGSYKYTTIDNYEPTRSRALLLTKKELHQLFGKEKGTTIVPLELFIGHGNLVKLKIGVGAGRKKYDKREYIKTRDTKRDIKKHLSS